MQFGEQALEAHSNIALNWLFRRTFDNLVYNSVWEDPVVDLAALEVKQHHRLVSISSAACNILSYLTHDLDRIDAVDLNSAHLSLAELKICALRNLPNHEEFFRLFGSGGHPDNVSNYDAYVGKGLSPRARAYWNGFSLRHGRRINIFGKGFYRHGVLGRFIGLVQHLARRTGRDISQLTTAVDADHQRELFNSLVAPLFEYGVVRRIARSPMSLFFLGVPPRQYREMVSAADGDIVALLKERIRRLACDYPMATNYFAWMVFAGGYDLAAREAVPHYLEPDRYETIRSRVDRVHLHREGLTEFLAGEPAQSFHRFVLLDSQDWMSPSQIAALWTQINRTANPRDARVIFRTAGRLSPVDGLPMALSGPWEYRREESERLFHADRSSIYGGFHIYRRRDAGRVPSARLRSGTGAANDAMLGAMSHA